jgi:hypothetical protein
MVWCHGGGGLSNGFPITDADRTRAGPVTHMVFAIATKFANACVQTCGLGEPLEAHTDGLIPGYPFQASTWLSCLEGASAWPRPPFWGSPDDLFKTNAAGCGTLSVGVGFGGRWRELAGQRSGRASVHQNRNNPGGKGTNACPEGSATIKLCCDAAWIVPYDICCFPRNGLPLETRSTPARRGACFSPAV